MANQMWWAQVGWHVYATMPAAWCSQASKIAKRSSMHSRAPIRCPIARVRQVKHSALSSEEAARPQSLADDCA